MPMPRVKHLHGWMQLFLVLQLHREEGLLLKSRLSGIMQSAFVLKWHGQPKIKALSRNMKNCLDLIKKSFLEVFWDEKLGYLADYVNDDEGKNTFVRPNMVIAVSLPYHDAG